ncbi:potassium channel subfamily K member 18 [Misgurnus anguillicaudatus]|uniref:potassium channel subfamily K member 18 n=1 Tax=Misgurnus anguillicaudatus TaxID=75329 RepID=UPI003CCFAB0D
MSVAIKEGRKSNPKGNCAKWIWCLFPHVFLILSLIAYAALGAEIFKQIENGSSFNKSEEIRKVLDKVEETLGNRTGVSTQQIVNKIQPILKDLNDLNQTWNFYGSLFFCCTVFTTIGYGQMYPVTIAGKVACILYAMIGIPLMLLVISDVGDILAVLLSKAYTQLRQVFGQLVQKRSWRLHKDSKTPSSHQGQSAVGNYKQDALLHDTITIQQIIQPKSSIKRHSSHRYTNKEVFDWIIVKEDFKLKSALTKSYSCPELDRMSRPPKGSKLFTDIGQKMDRFNVPLLVILLVVFAYMLICSQILSCWEDNMNPFDAFYFTFITLTTIGFGDIVPKHPKYFLVTFLFIIMGMAVLSMAFKLSQSRIVCCYRRFIKCLSMGKVGTHKDLERK